MNVFTQTISLGYICNVSTYLMQNEPNRKITIFDNIATPMWAVYNMINTNFDNFMLSENMQQKQIFVDKPKQYWVDVLNYVRFLFPGTKSKYQPLINNFTDSLVKANTDSSSILFIRFQELMNSPSDGARIVYPEYTTQYATSELTYLQSLSDLFKQRYPNMKFKILYMNLDSNFVDEPHNIVGIQCDALDYKDRNISKKMAEAIQLHQHFLDTNLTV